MPYRMVMGSALPVEILVIQIRARFTENGPVLSEHKEETEASLSSTGGPA